MPLQYTLPQYIRWGECTVFLMGNYNAEGVLWGPRLLKYQSPVLVAAVTDFLSWEYDRQQAVIVEAQPDSIGINNVDSLLINSTDKLLV